MPKFASAQIDCSIGEIDQNLDRHYQLIEWASRNGVDLISFPEMSITGYCREEAMDLAFTENDDRLKFFQLLADQCKMIIIAGAPILIENNLYIGEFIFQSKKSPLVYTKQYLHEGEEKFFKSSFDYNPMIEVKGEKISLAICADIDHDQHPKDAQSSGASFYLPSIFFSVNGMPSGEKKLQEYAQKYSMNVLMSNFCGNHWNTDAAGKSGFWNADGSEPVQLNQNESGLVIVERIGHKWEAKKLPIIVH